MSAKARPPSAIEQHLVGCEAYGRSGEAAIDVGRLDIGFDTQHCGPDLVIVTSIKAPNRTVYIVARIKAGERVGRGQILGCGVLAPSISNLRADVEAGPGECWRRRRRLKRH